MESNKLSIKFWDESDRPREKMIEFGTRSLSDSELIAIIIGSGSSKESAVELSRRILSTYSNKLSELASLSIEDLTQFSGIGPAKAVNILAAIEIGRRLAANTEESRPQITESITAARLFFTTLSDSVQEEFWILILNRGNYVIGKIQISKGGISSTNVDVRIILKHAIAKAASGIILVHNHPSGNLTPSIADYNLTRKIKDAAKLMDIAVLDHLIIGKNDYFSFLDHDKMPMAAEP